MYLTIYLDNWDQSWQHLSNTFQLIVVHQEGNELHQVLAVLLGDMDLQKLHSGNIVLLPAIVTVVREFFLSKIDC